jgi:hypothetical protein
MTKYVTALLLAGALAAAGCVGGDKQKGTIRQARPDDPREEKMERSSKKQDAPPPIPRLAPEQINEDNYQQQVRALQDEMDRELREIRRSTEATEPPTDEKKRR